MNLFKENRLVYIGGEGEPSIGTQIEIWGEQFWNWLKRSFSEISHKSGGAFDAVFGDEPPDPVEGEEGIETTLGRLEYRKTFYYREYFRKKKELDPYLTRYNELKAAKEKVDLRVEILEDSMEKSKTKTDKLRRSLSIFTPRDVMYGKIMGKIQIEEDGIQTQADEIASLNYNVNISDLVPSVIGPISLKGAIDILKTEVTPRQKDVDYNLDNYKRAEKCIKNYKEAEKAEKKAREEVPNPEPAAEEPAAKSETSPEK